MQSKIVDTACRYLQIPVWARFQTNEVAVQQGEKVIKMKLVLLAEALHRRLHSAFEKPFFTFVGEKCCKINRKLPKRKRVRQEEEEEAKQEAAERTGEDLCHQSGYNNETARAVSFIVCTRFD